MVSRKLCKLAAGQREGRDMQAIEQRLRQRYPHWFRGRRGRLAATLLRRWGRWSGLDRIDAFHAEHAHLRGLAFVEAGMRELQLRYDADAAALARIPAQGPLLVVANHPCGALDALALLDMVGRVRRDVRVVANEVLALVEPLAELLLPVRVFGGVAGVASLRRVERALREGECVIVFPAGEVSRLGLRGVRGTHWRAGFLRFARRAAAPVLPVRVEARNSALFYGVSALWRPASTVLLAREMFARRGRPLRLHVGKPLAIAAGEGERAVLRRVRRALDAAGRAQTTAPAGPLPLAPPIGARELRRALPRLRRGPGFQRFHRRPDRGGPGAAATAQAPALPAARAGGGVKRTAPTGAGPAGAPAHGACHRGRPPAGEPPRRLRQHQPVRWPAGGLGRPDRLPPAELQAVAESRAAPARRHSLRASVARR